MEKEPNKLSASLIKYLLKSPADFRIKFSDLYIRPYEFMPHFILGNAIHKVAEKYTLLWEWDEQIWMDYIYSEMGNYELWEDFTEEEVLEMEERYHNAVEGLKEVKRKTWLPEQKITLPYFSGYIDLLDDKIIIDYKTVGQFLEHKKYDKNAIFDTKSGYIIQLAIYAYWYYYTKGEYPLSCKIIEILKKDTRITKVDYLKKDYICDMIEKQYNISTVEFRNDRKKTREWLVEQYPISQEKTKIYEIPVDDEFIELGKNLYEISMKLRQDCLDKDMESFKIHHKEFKKICIKKIQEITDREYEKYKNVL